MWQTIGQNLSRASRRAETLTDRELMLVTGAFLWLFSGIATAGAGIIAPELVPTPTNAWRIGCALVILTVLVSICTWMRKLDDRRLMQAIFFFCTVGVLIHTALMLAQPLNIAAMYVGLISPALFASCFLPPRAAAAQIAMLTLAAVIPALVGYDQLPQEYVLSRVVAFMPILWVVSTAVVLMQRDRRGALRKLETVADSDPLTGVANLRKFERHAAQLLEPRNARIATPTGLLLIDLDDFKSINTDFGHAGGDLALQRIGGALKAAGRESELVARIGGDEFAVLIEGADESELPAVIDHYRSAIAEVGSPRRFGGRAIGATVGASISPRDGSDIKALLESADQMLRAAKADRSERPEAPAPHHGPPESPKLELTDQRTPTIREQRSVYQRLGALSWIAAATIGLFSLAMPDSPAEGSTWTIVVLCAGYLLAALTLSSRPPESRGQWLRNDAIVLVWIGVGTYLTGGAYSPLWPIVMLFVTFEAWVLDSRRIWLRLPAASAVVLAPIVYADGPISVPTLTGLWAGVLGLFGITLVFWFLQDNREKAQRASEELVRTDARTGLLNRREFERRVDRLLSPEEAGKKLSVAVAMIDLDRFKNVNTLHGHMVGDRLLVRIAQALADSTREEDCLARIGGDEFAVALVDVNRETAENLTRRYIGAIERVAAGSELTACRDVSATAGVAMHEADGGTLEELLIVADRTLMAQKARRDELSRNPQRSQEAARAPQ
jgi:diguanylate cyclase (GGDEF)-like protein